MKAWNKKLMTLACATCLTVGMGAVACADTVDLGYGQYANTSAGVKATKIEVIPTDAKLRSMEQNKKMNEANEKVVQDLNKRIKEQYPMITTEFKGTAVDGYSLYQLSGDSQLGHNTGWVLTYNLNKDAVNYIMNTAEEIVKVKGLDDATANTVTSTMPSAYSKANAESILKSVKPVTVDKAKLNAFVSGVNQELHTKVVRDVNKILASDTKTPQADKEQASLILKTIFQNLNIGVTDVSLTPYESKYGTLVSSNIRGSIQYDGFTLPGSISVYVLPSEEGLTIQGMYSEDTSRDYWNRELQHMYGLTAINGGK